MTGQAPPYPTALTVRVDHLEHRMDAAEEKLEPVPIISSQTTDLRIEMAAVKASVDRLKVAVYSATAVTGAIGSIIAALVARGGLR